jgi:hypothetical protein
VYDGGPEWEMGNWHYSDWDTFKQKLSQVEEIIRSDPDVKSRLIMLRGCHSDVTHNGTDLRFVSPGNNEPYYRRITALFGRNDLMWNYPWLMKVRSFYSDIRFTVTDHINTIPTKLFCCLQHRPHAHRLSAMLALCSTGLNKKGLCTFANSPETWERFIEYLKSDCDILRSQSQQLLHHAPEFLSHNSQTTCHTDISSLKHQAYVQGWVDIQDGFDVIIKDYHDYLFDVVVESNTQVVFFTEKTLKPIFWGKPFVILGSKSQNTILGDLGFETFPEYFDLSSDSELIYDNTQKFDPAITKHYEGIIRPLADISLSDIAEIKHKVRPKIHHNHSVMVKLMFDDDLIPHYVRMSDYPKKRITNLYIDSVRTWLSNDEYFKQYVPGGYRC